MNQRCIQSDQPIDMIGPASQVSHNCCEMLLLCAADEDLGFDEAMQEQSTDVLLMHVDVSQTFTCNKHH